VLASFRNLSQVRLIATQAHDGYQPGETIWTFGGAANQFTIKKGNGDPDPGPCAQHMARLLPNGDLTLFDNGSRYDGSGALGGQTADMCENPADPTGPRIARPHTRVTEYQLDFADPAHPVATLKWEYAPAHVYAAFAGSQQRFSNGHRFIGWSLSTDPDNTGAPQYIASEVTPGGTQVWSLSAPGWFSYRAFKGAAPDKIPPSVTLTGFADGATYDVSDPAPSVSYGCTDQGGSNLDQCSGTVASGAAVPMTVGAHAVTVTATDLAGNVATKTLSYTVTGPPPPSPTPTATPTPTPTTPAPTPTPTPVYRPDAQAKLPGHPWRPNTLDVRVHAGDPVTLRVRVRNRGDQADRFEVTAPGGGKRFAVTYTAAGKDVTRALHHGLLTPVLQPGGRYLLRITVSLKPKAERGDTRWLDVVAVSGHDPAAEDAVAAQLIAR
jgi:hypothetical protein